MCEKSAGHQAHSESLQQGPLLHGYQEGLEGFVVARLTPSPGVCTLYFQGQPLSCPLPQDSSTPSPPKPQSNPLPPQSPSPLQASAQAHLPPQPLYPQHLPLQKPQVSRVQVKA